MTTKLKTLLIALAIGSTGPDRIKAQQLPKSFDDAVRQYTVPRTTLLHTPLGGESNIPLQLLSLPKVDKELGLTDVQRNKLREMRRAYPMQRAVIEQLQFAAGQVGFVRANPEYATHVAEKIRKEAFAAQKKADKQIADVLTKKQLKRLQEIYLQELILSDGRDQLGYDTLDLDIDLDRSAGLEVLQALKQADDKINKKIQVMRWKKYSKAFDKVVGKSARHRLLGRPFIVDAPSGRDSRENPRRSDE